MTLRKSFWLLTLISCLSGLASPASRAETPVSPMPLSPPPAAGATGGPRLLRYAAPGTWDYLSIAVLGGTALAVYTQAPPAGAKWSGGILMDDWVRDGLRLGSRDARQAAAEASNWGLRLLVAAPFLLDAGVFAGLRDGDGTGALRIAVVSLQAFAVTEFFAEIVKASAGRARPYNRGCAGDSAYDPGCGTADANRSFFSGHSSGAFTGAGLICSHHSNLGLARNEAWDKVACASALTLAGTTAVLRIAADQHYASDVLVGAALGLTSGLFLPKLLHATEAADGSGRTLSVVPWGEGGVAGITVMERIRF